MESREEVSSPIQLIEWPFRILITGPCESGKTTVAMKIMDAINGKYHRLIVISPTFGVQNIFRGLDVYIKNKKRDIFTNMNANTFKQVGAQIKQVYLHCQKRDTKVPQTLVFVDDNTSNNGIHGGRMGALGNLTVTCRHYGASLLCISHQGKAITPGFRNNVTALIAFPTNNRNEINFISSEFGNPLIWSDTQFKNIIAHAWKGGKDDDREWGKHFLFVMTPPREKSRYFIDFSEEIFAHNE